MTPLPLNGTLPKEFPSFAGRFLLVDDEPLILRILDDFLSGIATSLRKAANAEEALVAFEAEEFDILITDRFMPGLDGLSLSKRLKEKRPTLKTILISGMLGKPAASPAHGEADLFLPKPFTRAQLLHNVARLLQLPPHESPKEQLTEIQKPDGA